jgi:nucleoside-triphosphatase
MPRHILLTGAPGCGKTTLVRRIIEQLRDLRLAGFFTQEGRGGDGRRVGFEAISLNGRSTMLVSVRSASKMRVSKYGVELSDFEQLVDAELNRDPHDVDVFVIDEIGKMECFSPLFVDLVGSRLAGDTPVLATVAMKGRGFISAEKERQGIELKTVNSANRDGLAAIVADRLRSGAAHGS